MSFLRRNKYFEEDNIRKLREEIEVLGFTNPVLVTFGKDAEMIAKRNLGNEFRIVRVSHYANYISKEDYREQVCAQLPELPTTKRAEQAAGANALLRVVYLWRSLLAEGGACMGWVVQRGQH